MRVRELWSLRSFRAFLCALGLSVSLVACGDLLGPTEPQVTIQTPDDGSTVTRSLVNVVGTASGFAGIDVVTVSVNGGPDEACLPFGNDFTCRDVSLATGGNTVTVTAVDVDGTTGSATIAVTLVFPDPELQVARPFRGETIASAVVDVRGTALHPDGIASVTVAVSGVGLEECLVRTGEFICPDVPLAPGANELVVTATDGGGGTRQEVVDVTSRVDGTTTDGFDITLEYVNFDAFSASQREAFDIAREIWSAVIINDLEDLAVDFEEGEACAFAEADDVAPTPAYSQTIDDLVIFVAGAPGEAGDVLGVASPCLTRSAGRNAGTNVIGYMEFDTADLVALEEDEQLIDTIVHEMGHVLGIGTNWEFSSFYDLLDYQTSDGQACAFASGFSFGPVYTGLGGWAGYVGLGGSGEDVPVEDGGGRGTRCGHWDEETFGNELMTGFLDQGTDNPLSELTVRSLTDIGYEVDPSQAEPYFLPAVRLAPAADAFPIAEREIVLRGRRGIDPATGEITPLPGAR